MKVNLDDIGRRRAEAWGVGAAAYSGDELDARSRMVVRSTITKAFVHAADPFIWKLAGFMDKSYFVIRCAQAVEAYWKDKPKPGARPHWSYQLVAEEVDFYLPKVVAACMKLTGTRALGGRHSPRCALVDVDAAPFSSWNFYFPQTKDRLRRDRACGNRIEELLRGKRDEGAMA